MNVSLPVSTNGKYATTSWGLTYGAGYNFNRRHAVLGELMGNSLYTTNEAVAPTRAAINNNGIGGYRNLAVLTGNYRLQFGHAGYSADIIAGGGMYYRQTSLSQSVTVPGDSVACTPAWLWWGITCTTGIVTSNQTVAASSSTSLEGNIGIGTTVPFRDSRYKFYIEARYHSAPN